MRLTWASDDTRQQVQDEETGFALTPWLHSWCFDKVVLLLTDVSLLQWGRLGQALVESRDLGTSSV